MRILGISGSLRRDSYNTALLRGAAELASGDLVLWDGLRDVPPYDQDEDREPAPPAVAKLREAIASADGVLFATPEYNHSVPGVLKNALDWASRPFPDNVLRDKPSAVIGASTGLFGAVWAQAEVRKALKASGAHVLESELPVGLADSAFSDDGGLVDDELVARLRDLLADLVREVSAPVEEAA